MEMSIKERCSVFLSPAVLTEEQRVAAEELFQSIRSLPEVVSDIQKSLAVFFGASPSAEMVKNNYYTYWRWYVLATWGDLLKMPSSEAAESIVLQLPGAFQNGVHVEGEFMQYCFRQILDPDNSKVLETLFLKVKEKILNSAWPVNPTSSDALSTKEIVTSYQRFIEQGQKELELAELYARVEKVMFPSEVYYFGFSDSLRREITQDFVKFLFFLTQDTNHQEAVLQYVENKDEIFEPKDEELASVRIVDTNQNELSVNKEIPVEVSSSKDKNEKTPVFSQPETASINSENVVVTPISSGERASTKESKSETKKTNYLNLKQVVEAVYPTSASGEITEVEGVLAMLDSLAQKYEDETIRELCYYNETDGTFHWNESLLA